MNDVTVVAAGIVLVLALYALLVLALIASRALA